MKYIVSMISILFVSQTLAYAQAPSPAMPGELIFEEVVGITRLHISHAALDVRITGGQDNATLQWQSSTGGEPAFRRNDEILFLLLDETVTDYRIELAIPDHWQLYVSITDRGDIAIENMDASVSAWSARGDVQLQSHSHGFSVTAMDGDALVDLSLETLPHASAITCWNGELQLVTPATFSAQLRVADGSLPMSALTAFAQHRVAGDAATPVYVLNNGDSDLTLRSVHGKISLLSRSQDN